MWTSRAVLHNIVVVKIIIIICILIVNVIYVLINTHVNYIYIIQLAVKINMMNQHRNVTNEFYNLRKEWVTSNLGKYLFKNGLRPNAVVRNKSRQDFFNVLIWKHWSWLKHRHSDAFRRARVNPLYGCKVTNCRFTGDLDLASADVVLVHLQKGILPNVTNRDPSQLWIFWVDESPRNAFSLATKRFNYSVLSDIFNWSMTYRWDSDIPIPYGRTIPLSYPKVNIVTEDVLKELVPYWKDKQSDVLASILISNCHKPRIKFLKELKKYMNIDIFGSCAYDEYNRKRCPGHFRSDCKIILNYLFYLVFENSKCRQYISEKIFHHAYGKGAIPVIMGPPLEDCIKLLPPGSFLHVENFRTPRDLALEIVAISKNLTRLLSYHVWRNHFEIISEHGYLGSRSPLLCRICEGLNYNDRSRKVYGLDDIRRYLDPELSCTSFK